MCVSQSPSDRYEDTGGGTLSEAFLRRARVSLHPCSSGDGGCGGRVQPRRWLHSGSASECAGVGARFSGIHQISLNKTGFIVHQIISPVKFLSARTQCPVPARLVKSKPTLRVTRCDLHIKNITILHLIYTCEVLRPFLPKQSPPAH